MGLKDALLNIIFTRRCKYCGMVIDLRREICLTCENTLRRIEGEVCLKCGYQKSDCSCCGEKHLYKYICAPFYYEGAASRAVWQLKFRNHTQTARVLAEDMAQCFNRRYADYTFDLCTCVPSSNKSLKKRGFNQAALIANELSGIIGVEYDDVLIKIRDTEEQHGLPQIRRSGNLLGCFAVKEGKCIDGMRILLCDDVKTTGSTLNECAKTLLINGAAEVFCITAAVTQKTDE